MSSKAPSPTTAPAPAPSPTTTPAPARSRPTETPSPPSESVTVTSSITTTSSTNQTKSPSISSTADTGQTPSTPQATNTRPSTAPQSSRTRPTNTRPESRPTPIFTTIRTTDTTPSDDITAATIRPSITSRTSRPAQKESTTRYTTSTFVTTLYIPSYIQETSTFSSNGERSTTRTVGTTTVPTSTVIQVPSTEQTNKTGSIVGGIVGSLVGLVILGFLIWYFIRRQRKKGVNDIFDPHISQLSLGPSTEDDNMNGVITPFLNYDSAPEHYWNNQSQQMQQHLSPVRHPQMYNHIAYNAVPNPSFGRHSSTGPVRSMEI